MFINQSNQKRLLFFSPEKPGRRKKLKLFLKKYNKFEKKPEKSAPDYPFGEWTWREEWRKIKHNCRCESHPQCERFTEKGLQKDG